MNRLHLKKNALNKKCSLEDWVLQTEKRADFLEQIMRAIRGFTVIKNKMDNLRQFS